MNEQRDARIDAYIAKSADFARTILGHLREMVHEHCPDVKETIKWGMPFYTWQGNLCHMAAFKTHCAFGFWHKGMAEVLGGSGERSDEAMGAFGRIEKLSDLPAEKELARLLRAAMKLNASGEPAIARAKPSRRPEAKVPPDLAKALKDNAAATITFRNFSPSQRREYIDWINEAKREETRAGRVATAIEWLAEGKTRHWKYKNC